MIVHSLDPVVLVGAADIGLQDFNILQSFAPIFVGVDGGADHLHRAGIKPSCVIGDLDSLSDAARTAYGDILHHIPEQDTVDFEKALSRIDAPLVFAVGFSGGRLDHTLAVLDVMGRFTQSRVILISAYDVAAIVPATGITLDGLAFGSRLSLMPLAPATLSATGLRWSVEGQAASPSNAVAAASVTLAAQGPVLVVLPKDGLASLADAVVG